MPRPRSGSFDQYEEVLTVRYPRDTKRNPISIGRRLGAKYGHIKGRYSRFAGAEEELHELRSVVYLLASGEPGDGGKARGEELVDRGLQPRDSRRQREYEGSRYAKNQETQLTRR